MRGCPGLLHAPRRAHEPGMAGVLISQNRMQAQADPRADLDLRVSLLAEREMTELIRLTREIARRMGIEQANDPGLDELQQDVRPEQVLAQMEAAEERELASGPRPEEGAPGATAGT